MAKQKKKKIPSKQSKPRGKSTKERKKSGGTLTLGKESTKKPSESMALAIPAPKPAKMYVQCPVHPKEQYRVGGFCVLCYGDDTKDRIVELDQKLDDLVLKNIDAILAEIVLSDDTKMKERFLGRILKRFERPSQQNIRVQKTNYELKGPVDFGRGGTE